MAKERKGKKLRRIPKHKTYYAAQFMRTETNRKRRMRNHIRSHPLDQKAVRIYESVKNFGYATFELTSKGRKRQVRADAAAALPQEVAS